MVEDSIDNACQSAVDINPLIIPTGHQLRYHPPYNLARYFACGLIENIGKVIFCEHRMSGIRRHIVAEDNELLRFTAFNDLLRSRVQFRLNLIDNRYD